MLVRTYCFWRWVSHTSKRHQEVKTSWFNTKVILWGGAQLNVRPRIVSWLHGIELFTSYKESNTSMHNYSLTNLICILIGCSNHSLLDYAIIIVIRLLEKEYGSQQVFVLRTNERHFWYFLVDLIFWMIWKFQKKIRYITYVRYQYRTHNILLYIIYYFCSKSYALVRAKRSCMRVHTRPFQKIWKVTVKKTMHTIYQI